MAQTQEEINAAAAAETVAGSGTPSPTVNVGNEGTPAVAAGSVQTPPPPQGTQGTPDTATGRAAQGSGTQSGTPDAGWTSVRQFATNQGLQGADQFPDDQAFVNHLLMQAQRATQLGQYEPYAREYMQHADQFRAWQAQQREEAARRQTPEKPKFWAPPEFNPAWMDHVERLPTGQLQARPGSDPALVNKVYAYEQYRRDFANRFMQNPEQTMAPLIEERAAAIAERAVQQNLAAFQERAYADQFMRSNSDWLHQKDQGGNLVIAQNGLPVLTVEGRRFTEHLVAAERLGIRGSQAQEHYARSLLRADILYAQAAQAGGQAQGDAAKRAALAANRVPQQNGTLAGIQPGGNGQPQNPTASLREQLAAAMREGGITDAAIANVEL